AKTPVIDQHYIVVVTIEIPGIFCPPLNTAGVTVKIQDKPRGIFPVKVQAVDTDTWLDVEKVFPERYIIFKLEIFLQFLGLENKFLLQQVDKYRKHNDTKEDIPDKGRQGGFVFAFIMAVFGLGI